MVEPSYQRLTRERMPQHFSFAVRAPRVSLWLGSDHVLLVEHTGYTEVYKRFYFRDIQAVILRETARRTIWNIILAIPFAIGLIGLAVCLVPPVAFGGTISWAIFTAVFVVPIIVNNARGPACVCQFRTAVQTEEVASLSRVRQTRKVLEKIQPLIVAAQGQLAPEEISARMQAAVAETVSPQSSAPASPAAAPPVIL